MCLFWLYQVVFVFLNKELEWVRMCAYAFMSKALCPWDYYNTVLGQLVEQEHYLGQKVKCMLIQSPPVYRAVCQLDCPHSFIITEVLVFQDKGIKIQPDADETFLLKRWFVSFI